MPNWTSTTYRVTGDPKGISRLYKALQKMSRRKNPKINNGFGPMWLGELVNELGGNWETIRCRGEITYFDKNSDGTLSIYMSCAWCEQSETRHFLEATLSLKIYYCDQESGCEVFETNDTTGKYFPDRYFLDNEEEPLYYLTIQEAAESVSGIVGHPIDPTVAAINEALGKYEEETETWYSFHVFEIIND